MKQELREVIKFFAASSRRTVGILVVVLFLIALPITILQTQQTQSLQQEASANAIFITVFSDNNGDGTQGASEMGLGNIPVKVAPNTAYARISNGLTAGDGTVNFNVGSGKYTVSITIPQGYTMTPGFTSAQGVQASGYLAIFFPLTKTQFGPTPVQTPMPYYPTPTHSPTPNYQPTPTPASKYSITGFVIIDTNKNGIWDCVNVCDGRDGDELGYKGAVLANGEGKTFVTNSSGYYYSPDVYEGYNSVKLTMPSGYKLISPSNVLQWYQVSSSQTANRVNYFISPN